jgi:hypothetical protein
MGIASHGPPVAVVLRGFFWKEGKGFDPLEVRGKKGTSIKL